MKYFLLGFCLIPFLMFAQVPETPSHLMTEEEEQELIMGDGVLIDEEVDVELGEINTIQETRDWESVNEPSYQLSYPKDWVLNQEGIMGTTLIIFSPLEGPDDDFKENVNLVVQDLKGMNIDMDQYVEISEAQLENLMTDYKPLLSKRSKMKGQEFHRLSYNAKQGIYDLELEQHLYIVNEKAYVLTFTREIDSGKELKEIAKLIFEGFTFKG